jgi:hypothetical protein
LASTTARTKPALQLVLRGEACQLRQQLDLSRIAYQVLDQPGPLVLRVAVADWHAIRALAGERGYGWPAFFCQSDLRVTDPFRLYWLRRAAAVAR